MEWAGAASFDGHSRGPAGVDLDDDPEAIGRLLTFLDPGLRTRAHKMFARPQPAEEERKAVPLSPREERILAAIEDGLDAQDPRLAAALARDRRPRRARAPLGPVQTAALVAILVVLVVAHAPDLQQSAWGTAVLTLALLVPWTVWATRCAGPSHASDRTEENRS